MPKNRIYKIFEKLSAQIPNVKTELIYHSNFELLIAVILSAQATDKSVNKATAELFKIANTPENILTLGKRKLKQFIKSIGLYNGKAENIIKTCKILVEEHRSRIPDNRKDLEALPGVGRKTANVILNVAFNQPTIPVDTHIFRVANRTEIATGKTPLEVENKLLKAVPKKFIQQAHHLLILHGRYTCTTRKPHCPVCVIKNLCPYKNKTPG
jgi:endonuclease-3